LEIVAANSKDVTFHVVRDARARISVGNQQQARDSAIRGRQVHQRVRPSEEASSLGLLLCNLLNSFSTHVRHGSAQAFSEFVATFGLLSVIWGCSRFRSSAVAFAVGCYITAAYWFTASTSFANPAVTLARSISDTFAGIRPADAPLFIVAQLAGAASATLLFGWLVPVLPAQAREVVMPHSYQSEAHLHQEL
jgi:hypothetical protein